MVYNVLNLTRLNLICKIYGFNRDLIDCFWQEVTWAIGKISVFSASLRSPITNKTRGSIKPLKYPQPTKNNQ